MRLLPMMLLLAACAPNPNRQAKALADEGAFVRATEAYLALLEEDLDATAPRRGLAETGPAALSALLDRARDLEAAGDLAGAVVQYDALLALSQRLRDAEVAVDAKDAREERESVVNALADAHLQEARIADAQGHWEQAIEHLDEVEALRPGAPTTARVRGVALRRWADANLTQREYAAASEHYRASFALSGDAEAAAWGAAVDVALGRYALKEGFCREAVQRFALAGDLPADPELADLRKQSERCARIGVTVQPFETLVDGKVDSAALGPLLADALEVALAKQTSRHVQVLASDLLDGLADPPPKLLDVRGQLTQVAIERPDPDTTQERAEGTVLETCPDSYSELCEETVTVAWEQTRALAAVRMTGSLKVVDRTSGEQQTRTLEVDHQVENVRASEPKVGEDVVKLAVESDTSVVAVGPEILAVWESKTPLPTEAALLDQAVEQLAQQAVDLVVELVDREEPMPAPRYLQVAPPVMDAAQLQFAPPALEDMPSVESPTTSGENAQPEPAAAP